MKLKHCLAVAALWFCCSYSYSETISGKTPNASNLGLTWTMNELLPQYTGLTINAVSYKYTAVKLTTDPFVVNVQNSNVQGTGYVFRSTDDWTGRPGNTITKTVPTDNIPINLWGPGEIRTQGIGSVLDPFVTYSYKYDTCKLSPVIDTSCPNYKPPVPEIKLPELNVEIAPIFSTVYSFEDIEEKNRKFVLALPQEKKSSGSANKSSNSLVTAQAAAQAAALEALNNIPDFRLYSIAMPGGVYQETIKYVSKILPDSKNSQRLNLSQQRLHNTMVESQYNLESKK